MFSRHTFMVMLERLRTLEKCTFKGFFGNISCLEATSNVGLDAVFKALRNTFIRFHEPHLDKA